MDAEDLKKRTKLFALRILKLAALCLTQSKVERSEVSWFERGPQLAQNYRASCRARSRAEFVAKIGVVEEEADESGYWLELIVDGKFLPEKRVTALLTEAGELARIMARSRVTASSHAASRNGKRNRN